MPPTDQHNLRLRIRLLLAVVTGTVSGLVRAGAARLLDHALSGH
jgi:hypothetical protein